MLSKLGIPLKDLPDHIAEQKKCLEELRTEVQDAEDALSTALLENEITLKDLDNYKNDKPNLDALGDIQRALAYVTQERDYLREQLTAERSPRITEKYEWLVPEHELDDLNKELKSSPIQCDELYRLANQLFRQPSKHVDIIKILRDRSMEFNKKLEN
jgi:septal ring factor EnvC (AmiA/AmiB activator)